MIFHPESDDLDRALAAARSPGDVIELRAGVYPTRGNWAHAGHVSLASGVRLVGAGVDDTIIQLSADAERSAAGIRRPDRDLNVLWGGDDVAISDLTIDGHEDLWRSENSIEEWYVSGLRFRGRYELRRVAIRRLRGSWTPAGTLSDAVEVFAVSSVGDTGGSVVEDVLVDTIPSDSYVSGIYVGSTIATLRRSYVNRCSVRLGSQNQFAFSGNRSVLFRDCSGVGGAFGFYNDTGPTSDIVMDQCDLAGLWAAVSLIAKDSGGVRNGVRIAHSRLHGERGIEVWDKTGAGVAADIEAFHCDVRAQIVAAIANPAPCTVRLASCTVIPNATRYADAKSSHASMTGCAFTDGTPLTTTLPDH